MNKVYCYSLRSLRLTGQSNPKSDDDFFNPAVAQITAYLQDQRLGRFQCLPSQSASFNPALLDLSNDSHGSTEYRGLSSLQLEK